jgi:hypothetical protein
MLKETNLNSVSAVLISSKIKAKRLVITALITTTKLKTTTTINATLTSKETSKISLLKPCLQT